MFLRKKIILQGKPKETIETIVHLSQENFTDSSNLLLNYIYNNNKDPPDPEKHHVEYIDSTLFYKYCIFIYKNTNLENKLKKTVTGDGI